MTATRIALVTGANRGIGREIARQLAQTGMRVILTSREPEAGRLAAAELRAAGLAVESAQLDVADIASCAALQAWLEREVGRLDVLINNAGIFIDPPGVAVTEMPLEILRQTLDVNLYGVLRVTQALVPLMRRGGYGRIVNLSSNLGQLEGMGVGSPAYRISKTALNALTRILAAELEQDRIKVNAMNPGWVRTDMGTAEAPLSVEQGADTALWLATLDDDGPSGGFFRERASIPW